MPASPASIYVLWHPAARELGQTLATDIFQWFRLPDGDGILVAYRSEPAPDEPPGPPLNLPHPAGGWQWIVALVEDHLVADPAWRTWLTELASEPPNSFRRLFPVALSPNAYNLPGAIRKLNFLRTPELPPEATTPQAKAETISPRLLKDLTEAFCRVIAEPSGTAAGIAASPPTAGAKVKVFLSHAKADSAHEARQLRDYLYSETQLSAFFDENDIALGYDFGEVLERALNPDESAALIVLQSDAYASRPWCRREVLAFRRPRPLTPGQGAGVWTLNPSLVVQTMRGPTVSRTIGELGTTPCIRWEEGRQAVIVTTLLREVLLAGFHLGLARQVPPAPGRAVINWRPDIPTLRLLQTQWPSDAAPLREIIYPHHSLPRLELDALQNYFPNLTFTALTEGGLSTHLTTEARATQPDGCTQPTLPRLLERVVGISISESDELAALGFAREHLRETLLTLSRHLLRQGAHLAYGGTLTSPQSFTRDLIYLMAAEQQDAASPTATSRQQFGRLYNAQPWPFYTALNVSDEARWVDACTFVRITQEMAGLKASTDGVTSEILDTADTPAPAHRHALNRALVLSAMRRLMIEGIPVSGVPHFRRPRIAVAILIGGRTSGFQGVLPGIFEEALQALRQGIPVFLVGGFGGAAARLAEYLQGHASEAFQLEVLRKSTPRPQPSAPSHLELIEQGFAELRIPPGALSPQAALSELIRLLDDTRAQGLKPLQNGLTAVENQLLFSTRNAVEASHLILTGLSRTLPAPEPQIT